MKKKQKFANNLFILKATNKPNFDDGRGCGVNQTDCFNKGLKKYAT